MKKFLFVFIFLGISNISYAEYSNADFKMSSKVKFLELIYSISIKKDVIDLSYVKNTFNSHVTTEYPIHKNTFQSINYNLIPDNPNNYVKYITYQPNANNKFMLSLSLGSEGCITKSDVTSRFQNIQTSIAVHGSNTLISKFDNNTDVKFNFMDQECVAFITINK